MPIEMGGKRRYFFVTTEQAKEEARDWVENLEKAQTIRSKKSLDTNRPQ